MNTAGRYLTALAILVTIGVSACGGGSTEGTTDANSKTDQSTWDWSVPGFSTDFSRIHIDPATIMSGGPPKDGIPAVDDPVHQSIAEARDRLVPGEQVILVEAGGESVIYPIRILTWHEIVNDSVGETPLAITFCPLCNTSIVFHREFDDTVLDFGTTGHLQGSNLLMYDRQSESWWQQATGKGVIGEYAGESLRFHPSRALSFAEAVEAAPEARVLSEQTGYSRPYGNNPYPGYDAEDARPFLFQGPIDDSRPAMERSIVVKAGDSEELVAYSRAIESGSLHLEVGTEPVVLLYAPGAFSALDSTAVYAGREVGSVNAFSPVVQGEKAEFEQLEPGVFRDSVTGSTWSGAGIATAGPAAGEQLEALVGIQHFWFSGHYFTGE